MERIGAVGVGWLATDGNAAVALSHFTDDATRLPAFLDWPLMRETFWADTTDDPDRQRRRMAELLVHRRFPLTALVGFAVRTGIRSRDIRRILTDAGRPEDYVSVRADWYYGYRRRG